MVELTPKIDRRTAEQIVQQLQLLLAEAKYLPQEFRDKFRDPVTHKPRELKGANRAMVHIFARFAEIIIERLNQVPDKNFLAFLNLLGASRLPPQPARVPLTFALAAGSPVDGVVPPGTQVAAPPAEGEKDPVIFETERELVVTAAQLVSVFVRDSQQDLYSDRSSITTTIASPGVAVFRGNQAIEHLLYIGHSQLFAFAEIASLKLKINLSKALGDGGKIEWQIWQEADWIKKEPKSDGTQGFTQTTQTGEIEFTNFTSVPLTTVNSIPNRWLRCRLLTSIALANQPKNRLVLASELPTIKSIKLEAKLNLNRLVIATAFTNQLPVDLSKDFFPFGEKPKFGDTFYLLNSQAFSQENATITINLSLTNPASKGSESPIPPVYTDGNPQLIWEFWNGKKWVAIGTSTRTASLPASNNTFEDNTKALTDQFSKFDSVFLFSNGAYRDFTEEASTPDGTTFDLINQTENNFLYLGSTVPFNNIEFYLSTKGSGYQLKFEYHNGSDWVELAVTDGTSNWTKDGLVEFTIPSDWQQTTINNISKYWVRILTNTDPNPNTTAKASQLVSCNGCIRFSFPEPPVATTVNGIEDFWIRVRIVGGNYGQEASYEPNNPNALQEGYLFHEATLAPPSISSITVDYQLTIPEELPEVILTYNDSVYSDNLVQLINQQNSVTPFKATEVDRPSLYLGFSLPSGRTDFPNRNISLFNRAAAPKYGEKMMPILPTQSRIVGDVGATVTHKFWLTNDTAEPVSFQLAIWGTVWNSNIVGQPSLDVEAGTAEQVEVQVIINRDNQSSDRGFLQLTKTDEPNSIYSATFETFIGSELPTEERIQLEWQYWNGKQWSKLTVRDDSDNLTRPGLIEFLPPADFSPRADFNLPPRYWLRVRWQGGDYQLEPRLQQVLLNTTMATQSVTIRQEILGSSDGSENQTFRTTRAPVLAGQQLEVRELEMPSTQEQEAIATEEGEGAIAATFDETGRPQEIWVRWHEVADFYGSGPRDRHYTLNHLTGEIQFGDGRNGLIPPLSRGNIRMGRYQTGGGKAGNKPAGTIVQLKTTIPYIGGAVNPEPAAGGAEAEAPDDLRDRAPHTIRHRERSVTWEDYEDLAKLASPEVVRAKCLPLYDLQAYPLALQPDSPGTVSVIVVPRGTDVSAVKPVPSLELLDRVQQYLQERAVPTTDIYVTGPLYVKVSITAEIGLASLEGASAVERAIEEKLTGFLHPLTGGVDRKGWDFGRKPHKSDLYALLESVAGVDYVSSLAVDPAENLDDEADKEVKEILKTGRFLVYSGKHNITLFFEKD